LRDPTPLSLSHFFYPSLWSLHPFTPHPPLFFVMAVLPCSMKASISLRDPTS
jgi:hypothetical protein